MHFYKSTLFLTKRTMVLLGKKKKKTESRVCTFTKVLSSTFGNEYMYLLGD